MAQWELYMRRRKPCGSFLTIHFENRHNAHLLTAPALHNEILARVARIQGQGV